MPRRCSLAVLPGLIGIAATLATMLTTCLPNHFKARMFAYEMNAIRTLSIVNVAQAQYGSIYHRYASTLLELGPPAAGGTSSADAADLIPADLAQGTKDGYNFTMIGSPRGYVVNANPQVYKLTGLRSFFIDQSTLIREHLDNGPASADDPEIK